jgi:hypothetical protein
MHDPLLASAGGSHKCDVKAPGALLTSKSIRRQRLFTASSVDGVTIARSAATTATTATADITLVECIHGATRNGRGPHKAREAMRTTVATGLTELWQISAGSNGDPRVRTQDSFYLRNRCLCLDPCCPHCSKCKVVADDGSKRCQAPGQLFQPRLSALPVAVLAVPLAWRRQWLA